jgi:hypothetical protein
MKVLAPNSHSVPVQADILFRPHRGSILTKLNKRIRSNFRIEENTKKNHKRVVSVYVIQIHVDLHKLKL